MNALKLIEIMKKYTNCPVCNNDKVGDGQGYVISQDKIFTRGCKCGWEIKVHEDGGVISEKGR